MLLALSMFLISQFGVPFADLGARLFALLVCSYVLPTGLQTTVFIVLFASFAVAHDLDSHGFVLFADGFANHSVHRAICFVCVFA